MSVSIPIKSLSQSQATTIRSALYLTPESKVFNPYQAPELDNSITFYMIKKDHIYLPFSFGCSLMGQYLNDSRPYPRTDLRFTREGFSWRPGQEEVYNTAIEQLKSKSTTYLAVCPSFGKTLISTYIACRLRMVTLIYHPRHTIGGNWIDTFDKNTNASVWVLGRKRPPVFDVIISCDRSATKLPDDVASQVGLVIYDEADMLCTTSRVEALLYCQPKYIIALSGTPDRVADSMEVMMEAIVGTERITRESNKKHQLIGYMTGIKAEIDKTETNWWSTYMRTLAEHPERNEMLYKLVEENADRKICIMTGLKDHAKTICDTLISRGHNADYMFGNRKAYDNSNILCCTISKCSVGFDENSASVCRGFDGRRIDLLILMKTVKMESAFVQTFGRAFRSEDPKIIVFVDDHGANKNHWREMKKWSLAHNGEVQLYKVPKKVVEEEPEPIEIDICSEQIAQLKLRK